MKRSIALIAMLCASTAWAEVGTIEQVENGFLIREGDRNAASNGQLVEEGDVLETGEDGVIHVRMTDDTKLVVGPETTMSIDAALIGQDTGTFETLAVGMTVGIMRMISGNSESEAYSIDTPVSTMGVRGTGVEHWMAEEAGLVVTEGLVRFCSVEVDPNTGERRVLEETCIFVAAQNCIVAATQDLSTLNPEDQSLSRFAIMLGQLSRELDILEDYQLDLTQCADRLPGDDGGLIPGPAPELLPPQVPGAPGDGQGQGQGQDGSNTGGGGQSQSVVDPTLPDSNTANTFGSGVVSTESDQQCNRGVVTTTLRFRIDAKEAEIASAQASEEDTTALEAELAILQAALQDAETDFDPELCEQYLTECPPSVSNAGECTPQ